MIRDKWFDRDDWSKLPFNITPYQRLHISSYIHLQFSLQIPKLWKICIQELVFFIQASIFPSLLFYRSISYHTNSSSVLRNPVNTSWTRSNFLFVRLCDSTQGQWTSCTNTQDSGFLLMFLRILGSVEIKCRYLLLLLLFNMSPSEDVVSFTTPTIVRQLTWTCLVF